MKYYIQRQLNEYGPYTLADLQRYVAQGSILPTDLTRSEGMTEWTPVSQVIGNIPNSCGRSGPLPVHTPEERSTAAAEPFTMDRLRVSESRQYRCREAHSFPPISIGRWCYYRCVHMRLVF